MVSGLYIFSVFDIDLRFFNIVIAIGYRDYWFTTVLIIMAAYFRIHGKYALVQLSG